MVEDSMAKGRRSLRFWAMGLAPGAKAKPGNQGFGNHIQSWRAKEHLEFLLRVPQKPLQNRGERFQTEYQSRYPFGPQQLQSIRGLELNAIGPPSRYKDPRPI